jgi:poly(3-hydroxybutyrate) depolymerase
MVFSPNQSSLHSRLLADALARERGIGLDLAATEIDGKRVEVRRSVVAQRPFCRLLHFERDARRSDPCLMAVAPLSGHKSVLMRDTLAALLPDHDLFLMEWTDARDVPVAQGGFALEENIAYVIDLVRPLGGDVHLLGLCQSCIPILAAAALLAATGDPAQPRSLILISGAIDPRINPTRIGRLAAHRSIEWFERHAIAKVSPPHAGEGRRVYPASIQRTALLSYLSRHLATGGELFWKVFHDDGADSASHPFVELFLSVMDLAAEFFLDNMRAVFHECLLPRGALTWRGSPVDLRAIGRTALMTVEGEFDDVSGVGQTRIAHDLCSSIPTALREHHLQKSVGHFGTFHGRAWRSDILPRIRQFIRKTASPA